MDIKLLESPPDSLNNEDDSKLLLNKDTNYCICDRKGNDEGEIMIQCEYCEQWFHLPCVNLTTRLIADIEIYACSRCKSDQKQIIYKTRRNFHRHDYSDANASKKPVQAGTQAFVENLLKRQFLDALKENVVIRMENGNGITHEYFDKNGFNRPILIENKEGLSLTMPNSDEIDLSQIENIVGGDYLLDVIDVERQEVFPMNINELNSYFQTEPRSKIYNLISFEISKTKLTENITAPKIVEEISWASNGIWPKNENPETNEIVKPEVQKYCLISAGKSYTDFHIDFGGSSVWYHVVKGDKIFYLIEPNEENLKLYENWNCQKNHSEIFLGDLAKKCYKFELKAGNTVLLPTGWIHAVYTPTDSLVFGGNFLQSLNIPLQIKCYEMEIRLKTPEKYRFPAFETLQWYAAKFYTQKLKEFNSDRKCFDPKLFNGLKYLNTILKRWVHSKDYYQSHDIEIPKKINCDKLVKIMSKELAKSELLLKANGLLGKASKTCITTIKPEQEKMFIDGNNDAHEDYDSIQNKKSTKTKEVLNFSNMGMFEIKLDEENVDLKQEQISPVLGDEQESGALKLKIKFGSEEKSQNLDDLIKKDSDEEDDDIKELKNSYQDTEYVYPSVSNTSQSQSDTNEEQKMGRKRKIKPHALHYLQPKQNEDKKKKKEETDNDDDYVQDEEDQDDEDFKLKSKNLKLSKKLQNKQKKEKTKEQDTNDLNKTTGLAPSAIANKNSNNNKKLKKGFATTKQRLGKLLKLNRVVNI